MLNELVTNCIKHAWKLDQPGVLSIEIGRENGHYHVFVQDDGVGMPGQELGPKTFGRTLVDTLARQLHATVKWVVDGGTRVEIRLPVE